MLGVEDQVLCKSGQLTADHFCICFAKKNEALYEDDDGIDWKRSACAGSLQCRFIAVVCFFLNAQDRDYKEHNAAL